MNKSELHDLFNSQLYGLNGFKNQIEKIEKLIYLIIENVDLLKDDISDEQIGELSSEMNIKVSKINTIIVDIFSDSKKLESFLHEIKLLKRKRDKKLGKDSNEILTKSEIDILLEKLKQQEYHKIKQINKVLPNKYPKNPFDFT